MCFKPKVKIPKMDTNQIKAPDPAPLTEEVKGVQFGGEDDDENGTSSEVSGRKSVTINKTGSGSKARSSSAIRKAAFGS